jgi:hypothetical protein
MATNISCDVYAREGEEEECVSIRVSHDTKSWGRSEHGYIQIDDRRLWLSEQDCKDLADALAMIYNQVKR